MWSALSARLGDRPDRYLLFVWVVVGVLTGYRWIALAVSGIELYSDEAYYWTWAQLPAFGYYSKPPMVAWTIALATSVCGTSELCIKTPAIGMFALASLMVFSIAARLTDRRTAALAAVVFATAPFVSLYSWFMTTDVLLCFWWVAAWLGLMRALERGGWADWMIFGTLLGLGLLSKYSMVVFAASAFLAILLVPAYRRWLVTPHFYAANALALMIFLPNLVWNAAHGWLSFRHTAEITQLDRALVHPGRLGEFVASQFIVFGPLAFAIAVAMAARGWQRWRDPRQRLVLCFFLPMLGVFTALSFLTRSNYNWALPAYVAGAILVASALAKRSGVAALLVTINLALGVVFYHRVAIAHALGATSLLQRDPLARKQSGWRELGAKVAALRQEFPHALIASEDRNVLAELMYYIQPHPLDGVIYNPGRHVKDHYQLTADLITQPQREFLLVSHPSAHLAADLRNHFGVVQELTPVVVHLPTGRRRVFAAFYLAQFKGYRNVDQSS